LLLSCSTSKLLPSLALPPLPIDCHAIDAALFVTGFSLLPPDGLGGLGTGFLPLLSPDLSVCSIVLPFSGLGLLLVFFIGDANVAELDDVAVLEELGAYVLSLLVTLPMTALSELFFVIIGGR
jgi:hypothetical protein